MRVAAQTVSESRGQVDLDLLLASFEALAECLMLVEDERIVLANPACVRLLGYERLAALQRQTVHEVFSQNRFCRELFATAEPGPCEHPACDLTVRRADGEEVLVEVRCTRFRYEDRALVLMALHKKRSHELGRMMRDSKLRFRAMFEGAAIGIGIGALDGRILESNPAFSKMLGYSREELVGMHPRELHPDDFQQDEALLRELMQGTRDSFELEKRYRRKDGSHLWGHLTVSLVRDSAGQPAFLIAMVEDTTERKRVEEQLREAEKMEVIGRLAGGIAHDFNNLLTGILLYCDLLAAGLEPGDPRRQQVEEIRMAGEQGAALTQQLLAIARKQVPQPRPILLNEVVTSTENLLRRLIGEQIELVTVLSPKLGKVLADQAQLRQVLLNLVLNARDAMPHGGRITVSTHDRKLSGNGQAAVSLCVEDTGCGMDEETRARLFEPFFTTKTQGQGTGLGLATVQRIVGESGGTIEVESEPGRGTRIEVFLPEMPVVSETRHRAAHQQAGETILLVDDHASARNSMQRILHQAGYRVLPASSGKRALIVFAENSNAVDLLIADWMMPGMNGHELAEKLRQQKPDLRVLLISGYHDAHDAPEAGSVALIRKPFAGRALIERIREVLDSKGGLPC
jgi:two-component system, cell cycle sensor histidine kinase and response regulator CckA